MKHQVLADQPAGIGKPVRKTPRGRIQQQPRRADAVAGDDDDFGGLELLDAILVIVHDAAGHAVLIGRDLAHPAMRAQLDACAQRHRPVGDVRARLRALRATRRAVAEIDAARPPLIIDGRNRGIGRPPVPAELVHGLREPRAGTAERLRRHRRIRRRRAGIAGQPRHAHHPVVLGKERRQRVVVNRPVIGDAIERLDAKVGRMQARPVRGVHHGRAADAVEVHHLDR